MSIKTIKSRKDETFILPLDDGNTIKLRTNLDDNICEELGEFVAKFVFDGVDYHPHRKKALLAVAFVNGFVVDTKDAKKLLPTDGETTDIYAAYDIIVNRLHIFEILKELSFTDTELMGSCVYVLETMKEIEADVDAKVRFLMDNSNAILAGGAQNIQAFMDQLTQSIDTATNKISETEADHDV